MPIDLPVVILVAVVALLVASTVAQRAGAHADRKAGRRRVAGADHRGPAGPALDVLDQSEAAYTIRSRLGLSTLTREERRMADQRAAAMAQAEEIRRARSGPPPTTAPKRIVVAGPSLAHAASASMPARSTVSVELLAAALGLTVVIGIVIGIWPRERGGVLSATGVPAVTDRPATPSPTTTPEPGELTPAGSLSGAAATLPVP